MLTQQEIGDHLGLSQQQVSDWLVRLGLRVEDGLDAIRLAYISALRAQASANAPSAERSQLTRARRLLAELELAKRSAGVVDAAEYARASRTCARHFRDSALALPDLLCQVLDPAQPDRARKLLKSSVETMLRNCAAYCERLGALSEASGIDMEKTHEQKEQ